jgi:hypothetical protein
MATSLKYNELVVHGKLLIRRSDNGDVSVFPVTSKRASCIGNALVVGTGPNGVIVEGEHEELLDLLSELLGLEPGVVR